MITNLPVETDRITNCDTFFNQVLVYKFLTVFPLMPSLDKKKKKKPRKDHHKLTDNNTG